METPCIAIRTKSRPSLAWREGYTGVTNEELPILLQQSRDIAASLETEMTNRHLRIPLDHTDRSDGCHEKLRKTAGKLEIMDRLDGQAFKHVSMAVEILTNKQTERAFKIYQEFLHDVLRHCSPGLVMVCAAGLGKQKIASMTQDDRVGLLNYVRENKGSLSSDIIEALATDHEIPCLNST